jgi:thymidine kinase
MGEVKNSPETLHFLKSLGFPQVRVHHSLIHFDFTRPSLRMLVIGPMGSGKTEYSSRVWRDSRVALGKSELVAAQTTTAGADRRKVFFIRFALDSKRFSDYPDDALAFRGGYVRCGDSIAHISSSFELEALIEKHPDVGTWILDEASFYDERLAYVIRNQSEQRGLNFIFPTLILNFRRDIFNPTAQFILEACTDVFPLTAYCEHPDCIVDSFYTYRYYTIDGQECPALYFDPLIIIGGDEKKEDDLEPNYCTRCDNHHYLPGKEYTFLILKPLGENASRGDLEPLKNELFRLKNDLETSELYNHLKMRYLDSDEPEPINMNALKVPRIAEKALIFLFAEQNLITEDHLKRLTQELSLDQAYMAKALADNRRPVDFTQMELAF